MSGRVEAKATEEEGRGRVDVFITFVFFLIGSKHLERFLFRTEVGRI